jgi:hypothetical protein
MNLECRFGSCLTVIQPGELFAVAEENLDVAVSTHKTIDLVVRTQVKKLQRNMQR